MTIFYIFLLQDKKMCKRGESDNDITDLISRVCKILQQHPSSNTVRDYFKHIKDTMEMLSQTVASRATPAIPETPMNTAASSTRVIAATKTPPSSRLSLLSLCKKRLF
jgi:hypothetical protein